MAFMFSYHYPYEPYDSNAADVSMGVYLNFEDAVKKLELLAQESLDDGDFPDDCYETGYGVDIFPEDDEVCAELERKRWNNPWSEEGREYYRLLDEEIGKHRITTYDALIEHLRSFGEPPEYFYGLVEVKIK